MSESGGEELKPEELLMLKFCNEAIAEVKRGAYLTLVTVTGCGLYEHQAVGFGRQLASVWRTATKQRDWIALARSGSKGQWVVYLLIVGKMLKFEQVAVLPLPGQCKLGDVRRISKLSAIVRLHKHCPGKVVFNGVYRVGVSK